MARMHELVHGMKPRDYAQTPEGIEEARQLAMEGLTLSQIAERFKVTRNTLYIWTKSNTELKSALVEGKKVADERVEDSLYEQCFDRPTREETVEYDAEGNVIKRIAKTKVIPANVTAIQYWLANRSEGKWKARQQLELVGDPTKPVVFVNDVPRATPSEDDAVEVICDMEEPEGPDEGPDSRLVQRCNPIPTNR